MNSIDKIVCIGKNYLAHALELGDTIPEKPVIFLKPASVLKSVLRWEDNLSVKLPPGRGEVHYECEIVLRLGAGGSSLHRTQAQDAICAVSLGLDMTLRTEQARLKKEGLPWTTAKVFDGAAIVGPWIPVSTFSQYLEEDFYLSLDGEIKQRAKGNLMLMKPVDIVMYISQLFPLCEGDLIYTGTPAGVGPVRPGQKVSLTWGDKAYHVSWL